MAFLFGKKNKNVDKAMKDGSGGVAGSQTSFSTTPNGRGINEKQGASQQSSTPASSVNNSITSLQGGGGAATPSPEQVNGRRAPITEQASDLPVSVCLGLIRALLEWAGAEVALSESESESGETFFVKFFANANDDQ